MSQLRDIGQGLIDPSFCCCAIPLVNFGIYAILAEQAILGVVIGVAALVTPDVVGASFPKFAAVIFAICCWAVAAMQPVGFIGILREKTKTFKFYSALNALAVAAAFIVSAALIIVSALRHSTAVAVCETAYFSNSTSTTTSSTVNSMLSEEGPLLCGPFAWADVGIMGGLWVLLFLVQGYFIFLTRKYSVSQVSDHKLYHSVYSENPEAFTMSILRSSKYNPNSVYNDHPAPGPHADVWESRPSMDSFREDGAGQGDMAMAMRHGRAESYGDAGRYEDAYGEGGRGYAYPQDEGGGYGAHQHGDGYGYPAEEYGSAPAYPYAAHAGRDPGQTPTLNEYTHGQGVGFASTGGLQRPPGAQGHPAEGLFGRKSPRLA
ncbi:hypothetical protein EHS25_008735 [Saitozyma podzolica]|uniref:Uncharacterized protein n=1 Tax=Saitozyma podzolica TaxID=1890683 RepID=A0A427YMP1_9TREE|nr:hypothetical protein EHS25_008735 [Saitozyma podzolica]